MTKVPGYMIRIGGAVEIRCMTLVAISIMQLIVAIHMARLARCCNVSTSQREDRCAMVERCRVPVRC